jgi:hypothetical protein
MSIFDFGRGTMVDILAYLNNILKQLKDQIYYFVKQLKDQIYYFVKQLKDAILKIFATPFLKVYINVQL